MGYEASINARYLIIAFHMIFGISLLSDALGMGKVLRVLVRTIEEYVLSFLPVVILVYLLYIVANLV